MIDEVRETVSLACRLLCGFAVGMPVALLAITALLILLAG